MSDNTKKFPWLLVLAFILAAGTALGYGYFLSQNKVVSDQLTELDRELTSVQTQLSEAQTSTTVSAQKGVNILAKIKEIEIPWSKVLNDVQKIIPTDLLEKKAAVEFTSSSGQQGGKLTFNAHTIPSTDVRKQLKAVSDTIAAFNSTPSFANAFVPSISKSVTQENESILTFIFNVEYKIASQEIQTGTEAAQPAATVQRK